MLRIFDFVSVRLLIYSASSSYSGLSRPAGITAGGTDKLLNFEESSVL
jgi:hypothetical protein